ncbi:MAG: hypothetical protein J5637_08300 [Prevotella sp.]|nr:hypothetical protein [Prevotella sp.]
MPYRRLPKTDAARLKALEAIADNNVVYTVEGRFIDREALAHAQRLYAQMSDALSQYRTCMRTQVSYSKRITPLQHHAMTYVSHFLQVLFLAIERGEIESKWLASYGIAEDAMVVPYLKTSEAVMEWAPKVIEGEKQRIRQGGKPILSPPIGAVITHYDVFKTMYEAQRQYQNRTASALADINALRPEADATILSIWNMVEKHYENEPPETRYNLCRRFGVVYYYRRHEEREC